MVGHGYQHDGDGNRCNYNGVWYSGGGIWHNGGGVRHNTVEFSASVLMRRKTNQSLRHLFQSSPQQPVFVKVMVCGEHNAQLPAPHALAMIQTKDSTAFPDPCRNFAFPPPPPGDRRQIGP
ncbi:hypothetical protein KY290_001706 [Solanum tuberosum]|uniref:Uncharacterized protein n=1 Tax=Solanum tuberosum TaxID=4113 RepID=A0ABQ7WMY7_SOLTU|nr:hypothetical protein KY284_001744 [Solanum tuberosum]KAH0782108.1 hypothetical protein KY290_001706 [Solanum tuberosum]